jgi:hypothetical protein
MDECMSGRAVRTSPPVVIAASSVNEDSGIDLLRFTPSGELLVKSLRTPVKLAKCSITPKRYWPR